MATDANKLNVTPLKTITIVFSILILLLVLTVSSIYLFPYVGVQISAACKNVSDIQSNVAYTYGNIIHSSIIGQTRTKLPLQYIHPNYSLSGVSNGVLLTGNAKYAVVALIDYNSSQFNSTLFIVNRSDNTIVKRMDFGDDFLAATIDGNTLYLYNSGLGYILNVSNGEPLSMAFTIDNYREVIISGNSTFIQTTAIIAGLYANGSILYQPNLTFNSIAYRCFVPTSSV